MATNDKNRGKKILIVILVSVVVLSISFALLVKYANKIIKVELERRLGKTFSVERIDLAWGHVEAVGVKLKNTSGKEVIRIDSLSVSADFLSLLRKDYVVSNLTLKNPYIFVEVDKQGKIVNPVLPLEPKSGKDKRQHEQDKPAIPVTLKKMEITGGALDYLDRKTPVTPVLTKIRNLNLDVKNIRIPLINGFSPYVMSASIPGRMSTGVVKSSGKINLKSKDTDCKAQLRSLDLTDLKPYYQKNTSVNMTKGILDLDINARVASQKIYAPGSAVLKDLEFGGGRGMSDQFMGVPLSLIIGYLKTSGNEIPVSFIIKGDLDNPQFSLQEEFITAMTIALAGKLGFSIEELGKSLLGGATKGSGDVGSSVIDIGKGLQKIFGK